MTSSAYHATKYPLVNNITEIANNITDKISQTVLIIGLFCKNIAIKIKAGKRTRTYLGRDEKLPEKVETKYPVVKK